MLWNATRPLDSSLDITKINSILRTKPFTIEKSLDDYASHI
jgi:dTDP-4-dehydrorhamnose reductase